MLIKDFLHVSCLCRRGNDDSESDEEVKGAALGTEIRQIRESSVKRPLAKKRAGKPSIIF